MKKISFVMLVLVAVVLGACTMTPTDPKLQTAGPQPTNVEASVQRYLNETLRDPFSVRSLAFSEPREGGFWTGAVSQGLVPSWYSCVQYNAKNAFGAYVGLERYVFYIRDDRVFTSMARARDLGYNEHTCW